MGGPRSHLYAMRLDIVGAVGASSEVRQVELDLVPAAVEAHRQHAAERVNARRALVVAGAEPTSDVLVVEDLQSTSCERECSLTIVILYRCGLRTVRCTCVRNSLC